jgi:hypothetical protein
MYNITMVQLRENFQPQKIGRVNSFRQHIIHLFTGVLFFTTWSYLIHPLYAIFVFLVCLSASIVSIYDGTDASLLFPVYILTIFQNIILTIVKLVI